MRVKTGQAAALASFITLCGVLALLYLTFADNVIALDREKLVAAEGLGIGPGSYVMITREVCMDHDAEATMIRYFRRIDTVDDQLSETPQEVLELPLSRLPLQAGCRVTSRRIDLPASINPGVYEYRAGLGFRNDIGRSQTAWLTTVEITVVGEGQRRLLRARPKP